MLNVLTIHHSFQPKRYIWNSSLKSFNLSRDYPHLVHIETQSLTRPFFSTSIELYIRNNYNINWNYAFHLYGKTLRLIPKNEEDLQGYDCTLGKVMRMALYGDTALRSNNTHKGLCIHNMKPRCYGAGQDLF